MRRASMRGVGHTARLSPSQAVELRDDPRPEPGACRTYVYRRAIGRSSVRNTLTWDIPSNYPSKRSLGRTTPSCLA